MISHTILESEYTEKESWRILKAALNLSSVGTWSIPEEWHPWFYDYAKIRGFITFEQYILRKDFSLSPVQYSEWLLDTRKTGAGYKIKFKGKL